MDNNEKTTSELIAAGHDPALINRTIDAAETLRAILKDMPTPPKDDLSEVFKDEA